MSESSPPAGSGGNIITRKYGPLPGWAWFGISGVVAYVVIRRRAASSGDTAAADDTTDTSADESPSQDGSGFGETQPYDMSGQVYTDLAGADAKLQREAGRIAKLQKRNEKLKGQVAPKYRTVTVHKGDDSLAKLAAKYHTTKAALEKLNPQLKNAKGHVQPLKPGEKVLVPEHAGGGKGGKK